MCVCTVEKCVERNEIWEDETGRDTRCKSKKKHEESDDDDDDELCWRREEEGTRKTTTTLFVWSY